MALFLGLLLFSFILTSIAIVPFISLLYRLHFTHKSQSSGLTQEDTQASVDLHRLHRWKEGTPIGGGVLIIFIVTLLYFLLFPLITKLGVYVTSGYQLTEELNVIFFTFVSFGLVGLYDDLVKIFRPKNFSPISRNTKYILKAFLSVLVSLLLFQNLHIDFFNIALFGVFHLSWLYVPLASFVIFVITTAFDYTDGLDGLAAGLLLISLLALWVLSVTSLDTPLSIFIALWIGSLLAFLYFNVYPARIWLGNAGSISFGATLAVIGLLLGKISALLIICSPFLLELGTSFFQSMYFRLTGKKLFVIAPFHHWLQLKGWPEPKIVLRFWLIAILLAVFGLWLATA